MTVQEALNLFNVLLDKYGSPYLSDGEIISLFNMALRGEYMDRLFPDNQGGVINFEFDQNVVTNIQPLIWSLNLNMNGSGVLTDSTINTALASATGDIDATYFRIASIGWDGNQPVKYVKQNDLWSSQRNTFKRPATDNPKYTPVANGLQFYPTSTSTPLTVTVVKNPTLFDDSDLSAECELGDYEMYSIIGITIKLAGISIRDSEVLEDVRLAALQNNQ